MSQTAYNADPAIGFPGMVVDGHFWDADSAFAVGSLNFGYAAFRADDPARARSVRSPKRNGSSIVWSGDFVAANVINGNVNGVALAPITFATSHLVTVTALGDAIVAALLAQGIVATYALTNTNRTLTFTAIDGNVDFTSFIVTLGAGQVTSTITNATSDAMLDFVGTLMYDARPPRISDGLPGFADKDSVACLRKGRIYVVIGADVTDNADAYVMTTAGNEGKFTSSNSGTIGPVGKFRGAATVAAQNITPAVLEMNLP